MTSILVTRGTLTTGSILVADTHWAKVRQIFNERGQPVQTAGPSAPVEITGWKSLPNAGDTVLQAESEELAKQVIQHREDAKKKSSLIESIETQNESRIAQNHKREMIKNGLLTEDEIKRQEAESEVTMPVLSLILKADVHGSVEAIEGALMGLPQNKVMVKIVHSGVGAVSSSDVDLAASSNGMCVCVKLILTPL